MIFGAWDYSNQQERGESWLQPVETSVFPGCRTHHRGEKQVTYEHKRKRKVILMNQNRKFWRVFPMILVALLLATGLVAFQGAHVAHASTIYYANPGDDLQTKFNQLSAGDTLSLNDGTYSGTKAHIDIESKMGTSTAPYNIVATHDGKALMDGGALSSGVSTTSGIFINNSSYVNVTGLVVYDDYADNIQMHGDTSITITRVTAWDAGIGNSVDWQNFDINGGASTDITIQDSAALNPHTTGQHGRYNFVAYHASDVKFIRDYAQWPSGLQEHSPVVTMGYMERLICG